MTYQDLIAQAYERASGYVPQLPYSDRTSEYKFPHLLIRARSQGFETAYRVIAVEFAVIIIFGHGFRHLYETGSGALKAGLTQQQVEAAIMAQIQNIASSGASTGEFWGRVVVDGVVIEYRCYTLPNGTLSVGTYYEPRE